MVLDFLDFFKNLSSRGGMEDSDEAIEGLSNSLSGRIKVDPCSSPTCDRYGDGYSLSVQRVDERVNKGSRAARARACEASSEEK